MSILIGRYEFEGPLVNWQSIKPVSGIYAILSFANQEYELVEIAETGNLKNTVLDETQQIGWQKRTNGMLTLSVHYSPRLTEFRRQEIVNEILREFDGHYLSFESPKRELASASF